MDYIIHPDGSADYPTDQFVVCHWHTYPKGSVLQGQQQEVIDKFFDTLEEAKAAYPNAEVSEHGRSREKPSVSAHAPAGYYGGGGGFYDAGEYWGEEDY